jgi:protein TonB
MNTRYVLPACLAGALHGLLFLGPASTPPAAAGPKVGDRTFVEFVLHPPADDPVIEPEPATEAQKPAPAVPIPRQAEPVAVVDLGDKPTMNPPPITRVEPGEIRNVPVSFVGVEGATGDNGWARDVVSSLRLDNSPRTRFQAQPIYPFDAKRTGLTGRVEVEFVVDEEGRVVEPRVLRSSDRVFEEATLRAVAKWQFEPGRRAGRVVRFRMAVPVLFNLND